MKGSETGSRRDVLPAVRGERTGRTSGTGGSATGVFVGASGERGPASVRGGALPEAPREAQKVTTSRSLTQSTPVCLVSKYGREFVVSSWPRTLFYGEIFRQPESGCAAHPEKSIAYSVRHSQRRWTDIFRPDHRRKAFLSAHQELPAMLQSAHSGLSADLCSHALLSQFFGFELLLNHIRSTSSARASSEKTANHIQPCRSREMLWIRPDQA